MGNEHERVTDHEDNSEWVEPYGGDNDAPHPSEQAEQYDARAELGYTQQAIEATVERAIQDARKGPWLARGATSVAPAPNVRGPGVCARCERSYAIRMLGECPHCQGIENRRRSNELASVIRELKAGRAAPDRERHLLKQLRELGHPHIQELLAAISGRAESVAPVRRRGPSL